MESIHPRLDETESRFGWSRGMKTETGVIAVDREARTTIDNLSESPATGVGGCCDGRHSALSPTPTPQTGGNQGETAEQAGRHNAWSSPLQLHAEPAPLVRVHLNSALRNSEGSRYSTEVPQTGNRFTISGIE